MGLGNAPGQSYFHALLWSGTAGSFVDLNPSNFYQSDAVATDGRNQVGAGLEQPLKPISHALMWSGTAQSVVDLNPPNSGASAAYGRSNGRVAGEAFGAHGAGHGVIWNAADPGSYVDLNPSSFAFSVAMGISGNQEVGSAVTANTFSKHAALWSDTAGSFVDLNPASGFVATVATATNGVQQVGYGLTRLGTNSNEALEWSGTADSVVNLESFLPAGSVNSHAYAIDSAGDIFGEYTGRTGIAHAVEWVPAPEPGSISVMSLGLVALLMRRHSR